jgi:hypothetical protein
MNRFSLLGAADSEDARDDDLVESDIHWEDSFTSMVRFGSFQITQKTKVQRIKYLTLLL